MQRVDDIIQSALNAAIQLRHVEGSTVAPKLVHARARATIDEAIAGLKRADYSEQAVQDVSFALVALMDERALGSGGPVRDHWIANLLQLHYFQVNVAGEMFFTNLERRLADPGDPEGKEVLRVYFLAMKFGFMGKYRLTRGGEAELFRLREETGTQLGYGRVEILSPHGARPREGSGAVRRALPLVTIATIILVASVGLYILLHADIRRHVAEVVEQMDEVQRLEDKRLESHEGSVTEANQAVKSRTAPNPSEAANSEDGADGDEVVVEEDEG